jgi:hypothetical protein
MVVIGTFLLTAAFSLAAGLAMESAAIRIPVVTTDSAVPSEIMDSARRYIETSDRTPIGRKPPTPPFPLACKRTGKPTEKLVGVKVVRWAKVGPYGFGI